jgi:hypothetical protein
MADNRHVGRSSPCADSQQVRCDVDNRVFSLAGGHITTDPECKLEVPYAEFVLKCSAAVEQQSSSRMSNTGSIASIFKRGGQKPEFATEADDPDAQDASQQLDQHLQQLSVAWAAPRQR